MIRYINYLTILLLPIYLIKLPLTSSTSLNFLDFLLIISILCNLLHIYKQGDLKNLFSIKPRIKSALYLLVLGFFSSFIINAQKDTLLDSVGILKSFLILPLLFSFTVSFLVYKKELFVKKLLFAYVIMSSFLAISGVIFFFLDKLTFDGRLQIFLNSPNALAMILTPGIIILLAFLHSKKGFLYIFILLLLFFHIFSTIATLSFGALLSLSFLVVFFIFKKTTQIEWSRAYLILSLVVILFSVFLLFLAPLSSMLGYEQKKPASSTDSRIMIYDVTKQIISEHLFWGIGPGNFQKHYLLNQANYPPYPEWAVPHPHNNILLTIAEGGVFALLGLLLLLTNRFDPTKVSYGVFLLFLLAYLLLHGIIDTTIWKNDTAVIFWLFLGILNFHNTKLLK